MALPAKSLNLRPNQSKTKHDGRAQEKNETAPKRMYPRLSIYLQQDWDRSNLLTEHGRFHQTTVSFSSETCIKSSSSVINMSIQPILILKIWRDASKSLAIHCQDIMESPTLTTPPLFASNVSPDSSEYNLAYIVMVG
eukprot:scaffold111135_cov58-Attheya_sp.AAC.2